MIRWIPPEGEAERQKREEEARRKLVQHDRFMLRHFYQLQQLGIPFEQMPKKVREWWVQRY